MIELSLNEFHLIKPLITSQMNDDFKFVFVHAVIDQNQLGRVFVNNIDVPSSGLVASRGGKYYVFGNEKDKEFVESLIIFLKNKENHTNFYDLYFSSTAWLSIIKPELYENVVQLTRSHYLFNQQVQIPERTEGRNQPYELLQLNEELYQRYIQEIDDSYSSLWNTLEEYLDHAFGFCVMKENQFASVCNTFYIGGGYSEPDIITLPDFRREGLALEVCQQYIKHSMTKEIIPYWDCDHGNTSSNHLALKLGFNKVGDLPILWWHENKEVIKDYLIKMQYA